MLGVGGTLRVPEVTIPARQLLSAFAGALKEPRTFGNSNSRDVPLDHRRRRPLLPLTTILEGQDP